MAIIHMYYKMAASQSTTKQARTQKRAYQGFLWWLDVCASAFGFVFIKCHPGFL